MEKCLGYTIIIICAEVVKELNCNKHGSHTQEEKENERGKGGTKT